MNCKKAYCQCNASSSRHNTQMTGSVKAKQCCEARIERGGVKEGRERGGREGGRGSLREMWHSFSCVQLLVWPVVCVITGVCVIK